MPNSSLISVVIPTYKRSEFLQRAINSVLSQSHQNIELIIIDDNPPGSNDRIATETFMQRYAQEPRVRYLQHEQNQGGAAARNTGIRAATGDYVAFLDDDDTWDPQKLELQLACFANADEHVAMVYTWFRVVDETTTLFVRKPSVKGKLYPRLIAENMIGTTSTVMCKREALLEVGLFDPRLPSSQDRDLYIRIAEKYDIDYVPEALVSFLRHDQERITKNTQKRIEALEYLARKYQRPLEAHRALHAKFLVTLAKFRLLEDDFKQARNEFFLAWRLNPRNVQALMMAGLASLGKERYEAFRKRTRAIRQRH